MKNLFDWVKRLGQWHFSGGNGETMCGMPMLGNNYKDVIKPHRRKKCKECHAKAGK